METARQHIAFALDYPSLDEALEGADRVSSHVGVLKVGLELFVREGPLAISSLSKLGCDIFLDLKLHDIPKTVERAVARAVDLGATYLTVHAGGGTAMLEHAVRGAEGSPLKILAVTVLTSLDGDDLARLGVAASPTEQASRLATLAKDAGVHGLVCSPAEVRALRDACGRDMVLVTPGIRPSGPSGDDQKRIATPRSAIRDGSSLLVVGRPIRDADDPNAAARVIAREVQQALELE